MAGRAHRFTLSLDRAHGLLAVGSLLLASLVGIGSAAAAPVLGAQLFWTGGDVTIELIGAAALFKNELSLYSADPDIFILHNKEPLGTTVTLTNAQIDADHNIGDELVFGIFVVDTSDTFLMGPGGRNPDGIEHATVDALGGGVFNVGFEDLLGGGDRDFDDTVFQFTGAVTVVEAPFPASLILLGSALAGLGAWRAVRRRRS